MGYPLERVWAGIHHALRTLRCSPRAGGLACCVHLHSWCAVSATPGPLRYAPSCIIVRSLLPARLFVFHFFLSFTLFINIFGSGRWLLGQHFLASTITPCVTFVNRANSNMLEGMPLAGVGGTPDPTGAPARMDPLILCFNYKARELMCDTLTIQRVQACPQLVSTSTVYCLTVLLPHSHWLVLLAGRPLHQAGEFGSTRLPARACISMPPEGGGAQKGRPHPLNPRPASAESRGSSGASSGL
jgi:hypothetical protein